MGLGDEYSRDALFRRPDQEYNSDSDREEGPKEPLSQEDWEIMHCDELYSDVFIIQEFVSDRYARIKHRYGVEEFCDLIRNPERWWQDVDLKMDVVRLWRRLQTREHVDPQAFQVWLEYYVEFY